MLNVVSLRPKTLKLFRTNFNLVFYLIRHLTLHWEWKRWLLRLFLNNMFTWLFSDQNKHSYVSFWFWVGEIEKDREREGFCVHTHLNTHTHTHMRRHALTHTWIVGPDEFRLIVGPRQRRLSQPTQTEHNEISLF